MFGKSLWRAVVVGVLCVLSVCVYAAERDAQRGTSRDTLYVLCIGNSFSWDAVEQELAPLCEAAGQPVVIGNLYYGGCSLAQHWAFLEKDTAAYSFRRIVRGERTMEEPFSLREALRERRWDYISLQQASHDSGIWSSYEPYLGALIDSVRAYQPGAQLCWMMTWAYAQDAKHPDFPRYGNSQAQMWDSIVVCTRQVLAAYPSLLLVPCGTAIQNARSRMGDVLCRDGYHLHYIYGRYTASCVWLEVLTGRSCVGNRYRGAEMTRRQQIEAQKAAHRALKSPFSQKNAKKMR